MTRVRFPLVDVVVGVGETPSLGAPVLEPHGLFISLWNDEGATTPADVTSDEAGTDPITGVVIQSTRIPPFWAPDGTVQLWGRVDAYNEMLLFLPTDPAAGSRDAAAASAAAAGVSATSAASSATTASTGAGTATTEAGLAATARTGAETARTGAETAQTGAAGSAGAAQTARTGAETARTGAETARDAAAGSATASATSAAASAASAGSYGSALATHIGDHANPHVVTKGQVGLGSVDNTSDAGKPVSTAQAAAIADAVAAHLAATDPHGDRAYTTAQISTAINNLINAAPGTLDTLGEIAAQLATDESAVGALTTLVNSKATTTALTSETSRATAAELALRNLSDSAFLTGLNSAYARAVSVIDARFGAVGDGVADDTTAINAAKTAALAAGRPLYFPKGTYLHTGFDASGLMVLGDGKGKTIIRSTGSNHALSVIGSSGAHTTADIRNLTLDAPSGSGGQGCFHADYADDLLIQDVEMSGGWINGCEIFTSARVRLSLLDIHGGRTFGMFFYQCQDSTIEFSRIHDITTAGRSHLGIQFKSSQRCSAIRNRIENINGYGIYTWSDGTLADTDHQIDGNVIIGTRTDGSGFAGTGIFLSTGSGHEARFNQVSDTEASGISVTACTDFLLHGNRVRASYVAETPAIGVSGSSSDFAVTNNRVTGYSQGYVFDTVSQGRVVQNRARNLRASGSTLSAGFHFKTATGLRVEGNGFIDDQGTSTSQRGFYEESSCASNVFLSNRSKGALVASGDWALLGTGVTQGLNTITDDTQTTVVTVYTPGSYTWTPVAGCKVVHATAIGGGGGGGSGRRGAAGTVRNGGGSGSGGGFSELMIPAAAFGTSQAVTVGAGGTGGAAVTADDTNGNPGTAGTSSTFGTLVTASPGNGGQGGTNTGLTASSAGAGRFSGATGAIPSGTGGNGAAANASVGGAPSGGAGGGITTGDVEGTGGAGGSAPGRNSSNATAGAIATAGGNGLSVTTPQPGYSGAGGGASKTTAAGAGGNGGTYGTGGGGGGASLNGNNSGKGGDGGAGTVVVIQFF